MRYYSLAAFALIGLSAAQHNQLGKKHEHSQKVMKDEDVKRVAIIGAGAAGSSASYHLQQYAAAAGIKVDISIFEKNSYIGGRTTTANAFDNPEEPVELGGSIFVQVNKILVDAANAFNLSTSTLSRKTVSDNAPELGVWDGETFVFQQTGSGYAWWDLTKLLWKYGYAPIRANNLMKQVVGKFLRMYEPPYFPWTSLSDVVQDVGLTPVTSSTGEQFLKENGLEGKFAHDIIQASTRVNYAQNLPVIHGLDTMVCLATAGAMSVAGGNWQIFSRMAYSSATSIHLNTSVESVVRNDDGTFTLQTSSSSSSPLSPPSPFNTLILATPYQHASLHITPTPAHTPDTIPYVHLHVTLFTSPHRLSSAFFNLPPGTPVPSTILTTLHPSDTSSPGGDEGGKAGYAGFFSISTLRELRNPDTGAREYLYKIFSPAPLTSVFLSSLLGLPPSPFPFPSSSSSSSSSSPTSPTSLPGTTWSHHKLWHSYPIAYPRITFEEVQLDEGLWYTSGIESFISTMETSALSGANVARGVVDGWVGGMERGRGGKERDGGAPVEYGDMRGERELKAKAKL